MDNWTRNTIRRIRKILAGRGMHLIKVRGKDEYWAMDTLTNSSQQLHALTLEKMDVAASLHFLGLDTALRREGVIT